MNTVHPQWKHLRYPDINTPWINNDNTIYSYVQLFNQFKHEQIYPEYMWGHYGEVFPRTDEHPDQLWLQQLEIFKEWYDEVDTFYGRNLVMIY